MSSILKCFSFRDSKKSLILSVILSVFSFCLVFVSPAEVLAVSAIGTTTPIVGNWTAEMGAGSISWKDVVISGSGSQIFAAVTNDQCYLYISTDGGATWSQKNSSSSTEKCWNAVASSSDGLKLVATSSNKNEMGGYIYTSTDGGATWTERTSGLGDKNLWADVASSSDGTKLIAVSANYPNASFISTNYIYTSTDSGATWTRRENAGERDWVTVASSSDGTKLIAAPHYGYIYTSTNSGTTWTQRTGAGQAGWKSVASSSDGNKLVAVSGNGYIYTSTNGGSSWVRRTNAGNKNWISVNSSGDGLNIVAVEFSGNTPGGIYISTDGGSTWKEQTSAGKGAWNSVSISQDGNKVIAGPSPFSVYNSCTSNNVCTGLQATYPGYLFTSGYTSSAIKTTTITPATVGTGNVVTLKGYVNKNNTKRGFEYQCTSCSAGQNGSGVKTVSDSGSFGTGFFSKTISTLLPNSDYNYRAFTVSSSGTSYGDYGTFKTGAGATPILLPTNPLIPVSKKTTSLLSPGILKNIPLTASIGGILEVPESEETVGSTITEATISSTKILKFGIKSEEVKTLQTYLNEHGYIVSNIGAGSKGQETINFGSRTKEAVKKFQLANKLVVDGIVGPKTLELMK